MEKSKLMMIIIIVLLVVLLATVAGVAFYVLSLINNQNQAAEEGSAGYTVVKDLPLSDTVNVSMGAEITTNLKTDVDNVDHIARVAVSFSYDETVDKESEAFTALLAEPGVIDIARSVAISCIGKTTYAELRADDGQAVLADNIKASLQEEFDTSLIVNVYFGDWVVT